MMRRYSELKVFYDEIETAANDENYMKGYDLRDMALWDWAAGIETAFENGREEISCKIAKNLKKMGLPVAQIAEGTGLDMEAIQSLQ